MLVGHYLKKAEEMQNEIIDLPDDVQVRERANKIEYLSNFLIKGSFSQGSLGSFTFRGERC